MQAAAEVADFEAMLDRLRDELIKASRQKMYGDLTFTVAFVDGVAMTETIGVVNRRKLKNP